MIGSFDGVNRFLSNFCSSTVMFDGQEYPTVEHAYQAAKTLNKEQRLIIQGLPRPADAKRFAQKKAKRITLRSDWELVKEGIMLDLLRQKFAKPTLRRLLLDTGDQMLVEGNTWGDKYWGVCNGEGKNRLGILLMQVRKELRDG